MYLNQCKRCLIETNRLVSCCVFRNNVRRYHSEKVFGFKRKDKQLFEVPEEVIRKRNEESNFYRLVTAYREHAHKDADIDPVTFNKNISTVNELELKNFGLNQGDRVNYEGIIHSTKTEGTVKEAVDYLREVYRKHIAAEFLYLESEEEREWFAQRLEQLPTEKIDNDTKIQIATHLLKSQSFDNFLAKKFPGVKRYGGEGAESMMAFFSEFFKLSAESSIEQVVLAMPHRGRLNLLTGMLNFPPVKMFTKLRGQPDFPANYEATGDVLSHCISSTDLELGMRKVHVSLLYNPSHLEAVNPVSMGKTRAKQLSLMDGDYGENSRNWGDKIINIQVHGDAAIMGQGVNQECLALSRAPHFEIGGSIHLVVNNQVGFTTPCDRGRSSRYCTDLAKIIAAPVIHVNGDHPEMVLKATRLAFEYQQRFRKEVFIDMNCYRQWGHNELDDPTFTNPSLYSIIKARRTVPDLYAEKLVNEGILREEQCTRIADDHYNWLNNELKNVDAYVPDDPCFKQQWEGYSQAQESITTWDTGVDTNLMKEIGLKSVDFPKNFVLHPTLLRTHVKNRVAKVNNGQNIDWATAEAMAFGSLLYEGYNVRISGQDVGRGTFSHRHVMLVDQESNTVHIPLNSIHPKQSAFMEVANSILSEEAVLGYEYGMSVESPKNLIIWEAQFGDFFNGAQIIFDTFISSGETKWLWSSGIVIMLPHGYDGAGPEHSSARIERFLQLTDSKENKVDGDNVNMHVCQPSTPAQYFHLLRRQMVRNFRKPLIIIAPKTLLRLSACTSDLEEMKPGTTFLPVLGDSTVDPSKVHKVLITSGKHFYSLLERRQSQGIKDTAILRLESFCPFPTMHLEEEISKFKNAKVFVWCQEEPQNMGAWSFVKPRFENLLGKRLKYCGRPTMPTPAVGVGSVHKEQESEVIIKPFLLSSFV